MEVEQPLIEAAISSVSIAVQKCLPPELTFLSFSNFFSQRAAPRVITQHRPAVPEAFVRIKLQRMVCGIGQIGCVFRVFKLRIDDDPILGKFGEPWDRAPFTLDNLLVEKTGEVGNVVVRKESTSPGKRA